MKRLTLGTIFIGIWLLFVLLACNLGSSPPNATLVPQATSTPMPTIGYATLSPEELPQQATTVPQTNTTLLNLLNQVDSDRLMAHVDYLQRLGTRHVNSPLNLPNTGVGAARDYVRQQFADIRAAYPNSSFTIIDDNFRVEWGGIETTQTNIIGFLPGREVGAGIVLVGAHYDSISAAWEDGTAYAPGANDNATGTAAVIELARIMASRPQPRSTIIFAAFAAEEINRLGSIAFINNYLRPNNITTDQLIMFNMDIIGSQTGPDGSINDREMRIFSEGPNESGSRQLARGLSLVVANHVPSMSLVVQDSADREGRYGDHMSFNEAGYNAVRFIEANEEEARAHTERDTIDDIQPGYFTKATQTILAVLVAVADGPRAPRNVVIRDAGNGLRTLVWEPVPDAQSYIVALRYPGSVSYNQYFETTETSITSEIFTASRLAGVAISGKDSEGLMGPLSNEYFITN